MTLDNYLQNIGEQNILEEKQIDVKKNPVLDLLCEKYANWLSGTRWYEDAFESVKNLRNSSLGNPKEEFLKFL